MSEYRHDLRKAADTGLQLRVPVDLVPATQYSRLSNAVPVIEGELRTREGVTLVGIPTEVSFMSDLEITAVGVTSATIADTVYPHGLIPGQTADITITGLGPGDVLSYDATNATTNGANDLSAGPAWVNPNNVTSTTLYTDVQIVVPGGSSKNVLCTGFGFAAPATAAITSLVVAFDAFMTLGTLGVSIKLSIQLLKAGLPFGGVQEVVANQTTNQHYSVTFDGSAFTNTDINDPNFGCQFKATLFDTTGINAISHVRNVTIQAQIASTAFPADYTVTVLTVPTPTQFTFTPSIPVSIASGTSLAVFGQVVSAQQYNNLPNTIITNLFRLNQALASVASDRIVAIGGRIWRINLLPTGGTSSGSSSLSSSTITAHAVNAVPVGSWPPVGWRPVCILPGCNPGGIGIPTATAQTNFAFPTLTGNSMKFSVTGPAYTNALWTYVAGVDQSALIFDCDYQLYVSVASFALAETLEIDMFKFSTVDNTNYMMGTQYNRVLGLWQVWDGTLGWINTVVTAAPTPGSWTSIVQRAHLVSGDTTHVYYDYIIVDGTLHWYSGVPNVPVTQASKVLPVGWTSAVGIQWQIDIGGAGSGGSPVEMVIDSASFETSVTSASSPTSASGGTFEELVAPLAPGGDVPTTPNGLSGLTLSLIEFRFTLDAQSWLIIADANQMYKYRGGPDITSVEFVPLGNAPPLVAATATAGGVGVLNSTGGTDYDWRYTYVDGLAKTESNPSPINFVGGGGTETLDPASFTNSGFNTVTNTGGNDGLVVNGPVGTTTQTDTCSWQNFPNPSSGTINSIQLQVTMAAQVQITGFGTGSTGHADLALKYSYDGGATFLTLFSASRTGTSTSPVNATYASQLYTATIPASVAPSLIVVKATDTGRTTVSVVGGEAEVDISVQVSAIGLLVGITDVVNGLALVNKSANVCVTPSPYPQHTFINLYRRGGSLPDAWRFVSQSQVSSLTQGSCGAGTLLINDNVSDTTLSAGAIMDLDNDQPVTSVTTTNQPLKFIWGPVGIDARVLGCGDPARPECVYFSKPGNADAWPPQNFVEVSSPGTAMIAGCVYNTRNFAFSRETIFELVEGLGTGTTYTPFRTPSARGLYSPWGLCVGPAMYFISKDGVYESTGGQEVSLVENDIKPLFPTYDSPGRSVEGYEAIDYAYPDSMRLRYHNNELYFIYRGLDTGTLQMLIYDVYKKRWRASLSTSSVSEIYSEPATVSSLLEGTTAGVIYQSGGDTDPSELNLLQNVTIGTDAGVVTMPIGTYNARVVALTSAGAVWLSYDAQGLVVDATNGIRVTFPTAPSGVTTWQVFYGPSTALENQFVQYTEFQVAAFPNRTTVIVDAGTGGTPPTTNADPNISVNIRTGAHDQGAPLNQKQYGNVIFDIDPGGATVSAPVTITPYINGEAATEAAITVTGTGRKQAPLDLGDYFAFNTEYEIAWTRMDVGGGVVTDPVLFQYDTLHFLEPVEVMHWSAQPTSFGFPGYVHVRDAYIAIRSTSVVTLTVTIDGTTVQTYNVASTGGERKKVYVQLASNKGLMYQFSLDADASFRVYSEDIEFRVKPWLGLLGYSIQRTLGGEVSA